LKTAFFFFALFLATLGGAAGWAWYTRDKGVEVPVESANNPDPPNKGGIVRYADPKLLEKGKYGPLPRIGADGRKPWQAYSRHYSGTRRGPRIAIVVFNLGLRRAQTATAIADLPGVVTLAFSPYGSALAKFGREARNDGHEIVLQLPLRPADTDYTDRGPYAISPIASQAENRDRLHWVLSRMSGYVGLLGASGNSLEANSGAYADLIASLGRRGLVYVQPGGQTGPNPAAYAKANVPWANVGVWLDREPSEAGIEAAQRRAEALIKQNGTVVVIAQPYALTIRKVKSWIAALEASGIAVAPLSAVVKTPPSKSEN
jgi:polysaccharide deacetylase 2 family uncharacterized protein YibQ